jgi:hypothetical protein
MILGMKNDFKCFEERTLRLVVVLAEILKLTRISKFFLNEMDEYEFGILAI